jgi:hypothetical protein
MQGLEESMTAREFLTNITVILMVMAVGALLETVGFRSIGIPHWRSRCRRAGKVTGSCHHRRDVTRKSTERSSAEIPESLDPQNFCLAYNLGAAGCLAWLLIRADALPKCRGGQRMAG